MGWMFMFSRIPILSQPPSKACGAKAAMRLLLVLAGDTNAAIFSFRLSLASKRSAATEREVRYLP